MSIAGIPDELAALFVETRKRHDSHDGGGIAPALAVTLDRHEQMCLARWLKELPVENAEQRAEIERKALDGAESRVYRAFLAADENNIDLNAMTVPELTAMVMRAVRGGHNAPE
jgi:hypothetical protein